MTDTKDDGTEQGKYDTLGGFNRYEVNSLLQKCTRRSQPDLAEWAAWELARSGYAWNVWDRLTLYIIEDLKAGQTEANQIRRYESLATYRYSQESGPGIRCAMRAARVAANATSTRESTFANDYFDKITKDRVVAQEEGRDPLYDLPIDTEAHAFDGDKETDSSGASGQMTFGDGGEMEFEVEDDSDGDDFGNPLGKGETKGQFDRTTLIERFREAVINDEQEVAAFCAWELCRSGYGDQYWDQVQLAMIDDTVVDSSIELVVDRYEQMAKKKYDDTAGWQGKLCAMHAALALARTDTNDIWGQQLDYEEIADERGEALANDETPDVEFPCELDELKKHGKYDVCIDRHTLPGKKSGRNWRHFKTHAGRVGPEGEHELAQRWRARSMKMDSMGYRENEVEYTQDEIAHSVKPVGPDDPWSEPDVMDNDGMDG